MRSVTSTSGEVRLIRSLSSFWTRKVDFITRWEGRNRDRDFGGPRLTFSFNSVGVMRPCTVLAPRYLRAKTRSTSSTKLDTSTIRSWCVHFSILCPARSLNVCFSTALKARFTRKESAGAIQRRALVSFFPLSLCFTALTHGVAGGEMTDREWYSCLNRYDALFK